jgi:hypothetical protein
MRIRLRIVSIYIGVGLGALIVALALNPKALVPHPPYWGWIFVRLLLIASLAALGTLLVFGVEDDLAVFEEESREHAMEWRAVWISFLVGVLASATFAAASALVDYLDRRIT